MNERIESRRTHEHLCGFLRELQGWLSLPVFAKQIPIGEYHSMFQRGLADSTFEALSHRFAGWQPEFDLWRENVERIRDEPDDFVERKQAIERDSPGFTWDRQATRFVETAIGILEPAIFHRGELPLGWRPRTYANVNYFPAAPIRTVDDLIPIVQSTLNDMREDASSGWSGLGDALYDSSRRGLMNVRDALRIFSPGHPAIADIGDIPLGIDYDVLRGKFERLPEVLSSHKAALATTQHTANAQVSRPDGPEPPSRLWFNNRSICLSPKAFSFISHMWSRESEQIRIIENLMWKPLDDRSRGTLQNAITEVNKALSNLGCHEKRFGIKGLFVTLKKPTKNSPKNFSDQ